MKKTVKDIDVKGKKVLVRCDFNVPQKDGVITDDIRIVSALPTVEYLAEQGAKVEAKKTGLKNAAIEAKKAAKAEETKVNAARAEAIAKKAAELAAKEAAEAAAAEAPAEEVPAEVEAEAPAEA